VGDLSPFLMCINLTDLPVHGQKISKFLREESNLLYVAATRAKKSLIMSNALCELLQFKKVIK